MGEAETVQPQGHSGEISSMSAREDTKTQSQAFRWCPVPEEGIEHKLKEKLFPLNMEKNSFTVG